MKSIGRILAAVIGIVGILVGALYLNHFIRAMPPGGARPAVVPKKPGMVIPALAPLPASFPLRGEEGLDALGYPRQSVDQAALRSLLWHGEFKTLTHDIEELQRRFEEDPRREFWPMDASEAFSSPEPKLDQQLEAWIKATPDSFAPYLARGAHQLEVGYARRGGKYISATPEENLVAMNQHLPPAMEDLRRAVSMRPKLIAALRMELMAIQFNPRNGDADAVIQQAIALCPSCLRVRVTYMLGLRPRWGGSYAAMDAFAKASIDPRWPQLATLAGYADSDRADLLNSAHRSDEAMAYIDKAISLGDNPDFLALRARIQVRRHNMDAALKDINRSLSLRPDYLDAIYDRAWIKNAAGDWEGAGIDLLAGLRVNPGNELARDITANTVSGVVYQGWTAFKAGKHDEAVRLFDLATTLDPNNEDAQKWRMWAIAGKEDASPDAAVAAAEQELKDHPGEFGAIQRLDDALSRKGAFERALPLWDAYVAAHPGDGAARNQRANALRHLGRKGEAKEESAQACALGSSAGCAHTSD